MSIVSDVSEYLGGENLVNLKGLFLKFAKIIFLFNFEMKWELLRVILSISLMQ